jgi:hypothetical protein
MLLCGSEQAHKEDKIDQNFLSNSPIIITKGAQIA